MSLLEKLSRKILRLGALSCLACLCATGAHAVTYTFPPGTPPNASAPQLLANGDILNVNSGTFQTTNSTNYTVNPLQDATINIAAGSTVSYAGTNPSGATLYANRNNSAQQRIYLNGTLSAGNSSYALNYSNGNLANTDAVHMNVSNGAKVYGNITSNGLQSILLYVSGTGTFYGPVNLPFLMGGPVNYSSLFVGVNFQTSTIVPTNYVTQDWIHVYFLSIFNNSTMTINHTMTGRTLQLLTDTAIYVNTTLYFPTITGQGTVSLAADLNMLPQDTVIVSTFGTNNLIATKNVSVIQNSEIGVFEVTNNYTSIMADALNYGNVTVGGAALGTTTNMQNAQVQYEGGYFPSGTYTIYSNTNPFDITPTVSAPPSNTLFLTFATPVVSTNTITINITQTPLQSLTNGAINNNIADVLQNMVYTGSTAPQATLLNAIFASPNQAAYNNNVHQLMPNMNASSTNVMLQNTILQKTELRLTSLKDENPYVSGIASGDFCGDKAMWIGTFGSIAQQNPLDLNEGYRAKSWGGILGLDVRRCETEIFGLAFAFSDTNVDEFSNNNFNTRILGYNALFYGTTNLESETLFAEWMLMGVFNQNIGNRAININGNNFSVSSSYQTFQAGVRINFGQFTHDDYWGFSLIETFRYTYAYQPSYDEVGSVAALNVAPQQNSNLLTLGGGVRLSLLDRDTWCDGNREVRIMGTYDVIKPRNTLYANFLVGSPSFSIINPISPWGIEFGVDFTFTFFCNAQLQFSYDFTLRNHYINNAGSVKIKYLF